MTTAVATLATPENYDGDYRLDLRLGIPEARLRGALEWWLGDPGLCKSPDQHPFLILLEIDSSGRIAAEQIMHAIDRIVAESGPIRVSIRLIQEIFHEEASLYQVIPSAGLNDLVFLLSRAFPVVVNQGTLAHCIYEGTSGSFTALHPVRLSDPARSRFLTPKRDGQGASVKTREPAHLSLAGSSPWDKLVPVDVFRLVLRKNDIPVAEYDLVRKKWLNPARSCAGKQARSALRLFRQERGYQMTSSGHSGEPKIFVMSDLHLGHSNSIPRYKRPFIPGYIREMDRILIRNWNWTVKGTDTIFFLGDLSYMSEELPEDYLGQLGGNIVYIEGNHDPCIPDMPHCVLMRYRDVPYLLIHDPAEIVKPFPGWVIHGHVHNKDITRYPFFDPIRKRINVSAEMVGYRPISFDEIHDLVANTDRILEFRDLHSVSR